MLIGLAQRIEAGVDGIVHAPYSPARPKGPQDGPAREGQRKPEGQGQQRSERHWLRKPDLSEEDAPRLHGPGCTTHKLFVALKSNFLSRP